jgi:4-amino-4-deoxy-L-arabinose transferase-like glycosyltransferase
MDREPSPESSAVVTPQESAEAARPWIAIAIGLAVMGALAGWSDARYGWISHAFDFVAHQFYEIPLLARFRRPSQLILVRVHLAIALALLVLGLASFPRLKRHGRLWVLSFWVGYALRAGVWIIGGNLPLVPGDSCHYVEVATSVLRGEGPVKHYVESFFIDYPAIRQGRGVLDDWATPLDAYVRAACFRLARINPGEDLETTFGVAKACSFAINLLTLPLLYLFARRRFGPDVALGSMALLAVLPVHALYAGFVLRESLVAFTSLLAVWTLTETWNASTHRAAWLWALAAGIAGGLAILARNTAMAIMAACGLHALVLMGRRRPGPLLAWGVGMVLVILPWALATAREYGTPFYSYTSYFEYNFSWTIHHYERGNTRPEQFYTLTNMPEIVRVKLKCLFIIVCYSTMIVGLPFVAAFLGRLWRPSDPRGRDVDRLAATVFAVFVLATLKSVPDVTQVAQLARYYLPVYLLAIPTAVAGARQWLATSGLRARSAGWLAATYIALLWSDPTWSYDYSWLVKPYQLHLPALRASGEWMRNHPAQVPPDARVMTWFPWEVRVTSDRTTVLLPRNYSARRIDEVIRQYRVTHVLWGSFEPPPHVDPETWGPYLEQVRTALGLTESREVYRSPRDLPYPVRLYKLP